MHEVWINPGIWILKLNAFKYHNTSQSVNMRRLRSISLPCFVPLSEKSIFFNSRNTSLLQKFSLIALCEEFAPYNSN